MSDFHADDVYKFIKNVEDDNKIANRKLQHYADFKIELEKLINKYSQENTSNTPDFVLAEYLCHCLEVFNIATQTRETWYGRWKGECSISTTICEFNKLDKNGDIIELAPSFVDDKMVEVSFIHGKKTK